MSRSTKPKKPKDSATKSRNWWQASRPALAGVLTLIFASAVLLAVHRLGDEAQQRIGPRERYQVRFADIVCEAPPGLERSTFLTEVRYVGRLPDTFNALDPADRDRITTAFAAHPWVEAVGAVLVEPPLSVQMKLRFRVPVLAVKVTGKSVRLVDAQGVLLPETPVPSSVADLVNPVPEPRTPAGQVWADDTVKRAVELIDIYKPTRLERGPLGWRLTLANRRTVHIGR